MHQELVHKSRGSSGQVRDHVPRRLPDPKEKTPFIRGGWLSIIWKLGLTGLR
jgi:hypothetical protein